MVPNEMTIVFLCNVAGLDHGVLMWWKSPKQYPICTIWHGISIMVPWHHVPCFCMHCQSRKTLLVQAMASEAAVNAICVCSASSIVE